MNPWSQTCSKPISLAEAVWRPLPSSYTASGRLRKVKTKGPAVTPGQRRAFFDLGTKSIKLPMGLSDDEIPVDEDTLREVIASEESGPGVYRADAPRTIRTGEVTRFLQASNPITNEDKVRFVEEGHGYTVKSRFYPGVTISNLPETNDKRLPQIVSTTVIKKLYFQPFHRDFIARRTLNGKTFSDRRHDPTYKYFGCRSIDDILRVWEDAMYKGTIMHAAFEDLANLVEMERRTGPPGERLFALDGEGRLLKPGTRRSIWKYVRQLRNLPEIRYFFEFCKRMRMHVSGPTRFVFFRTELSMWNEVLHLSGTIDALLYDTKAKHFIIADWKRVTGGIKVDPVGGKPAHLISPGSRGLRLPFFMNLRSNSYNEYAFQTTVYRHMFETMTGQPVGDLLLVAVDSTKIGQRDALEIHAIRHDYMDEGYRGAAAERAQDMLDNFEATLSEEHKDELKKYL